MIRGDAQKLFAVPFHFLGAVGFPAEAGVNEEPEKILQQAKERDTAQSKTFPLHRPMGLPEERPMKDEEQECERPGVIPGQRAAAHENVYKEMLLNSPAGQVFGPAIFAFDFHFEFCPNERADDNGQ